MITTREAVERCIEKGIKDERAKPHIEYVKERWAEGKTDADLQYSYDIICDNS